MGEPQMITTNTWTQLEEQPELEILIEGDFTEQRNIRIREAQPQS